MNNPEDVLIVGLGGAGCRVVASLMDSASPFDLAVVDTDKTTLAPFDGRPVTIIRAGTGWAWREGTGCGGDVVRGEQAIAGERHSITRMMQGKKLIICAAGLGGGVSSGGVRTIASVARHLEIPAVFLLTTPFSFESFAKRKNAEKYIEDLLPIADVVIRLPNDLLFSMLPAETPFDEAFSKSCRELAGCASGIAAMLNCENMLGSDYAGFMEALKGKLSFCGLGVGTAEGSEGLDRCGLAIERMLASPFLGGISKLEQTDAAILTVCGGADLQIGEVKRIFEILQGMLPAETKLLTGVNISESVMDRIQITAVSIKYDHSKQPAEKEKKGNSPRRKKDHPAVQADMEQGVFDLEIYNKGIFSNTPPTMHKGVDLDIPAYQRNEVYIDKGTTSR